ncbi:MAG TPA: alpha-hydroxy-acid oxidizing protein [Vicinamibacterales bacterium]|nr:alpha-hydroxy-acid oxidizing protein [Vicinamibacterales bacterium]
MTRRQALARVAAQAVGAQRLRPAPRNQLVNTFEYEEQARRVIPPAIASLIADTADRNGAVSADRQALDRITLRPRMMVPTLDLDLTVTLFGEITLAPIVVAPVADQKRFHPEGEAATVKGAAAANAPVIVSSQSSIPIADLVAGAATPIWYQVFAADPAAKQQVRSAVDAGCGVICVTIHAKPLSTAGPVRVDWATVGALVEASRVPVILKGVTSVGEATGALKLNVQGIVVSSYGGVAPEAPSLVMQLPAIVDAVAGQVPVFVDGGFRRGTDILKALAFGARAVLIGRPVMWGLAAYGADGVQGVIEMLQTELARYMAMCGRSRLAMLGRDVLRVHDGLIRPATSSIG